MMTLLNFLRLGRISTLHGFSDYNKSVKKFKKLVEANIGNVL